MHTGRDQLSLTFSLFVLLTGCGCCSVEYEDPTNYLLLEKGVVHHVNFKRASCTDPLFFIPAPRPDRVVIVDKDARVSAKAMYHETPSNRVISIGGLGALVPSLLTDLPGSACCWLIANDPVVVAVGSTEASLLYEQPGRFSSDERVRLVREVDLAEPGKRLLVLRQFPSEPIDWRAVRHSVETIDIRAPRTLADLFREQPWESNAGRNAKQ